MMQINHDEDDDGSGAEGDPVVVGAVVALWRKQQLVGSELSKPTS